MNIFKKKTTKFRKKRCVFTSLQHTKIRSAIILNLNLYEKKLMGTKCKIKEQYYYIQKCFAFPDFLIPKKLIIFIILILF